jgi:uncharacterized membrane protein YhaH (DUF805 family)
LNVINSMVEAAALGQYGEMERIPEGPGAVTMIVYLAICVAMIAAMWKIFAKAGKPGWASIVPIYNIVVWLKVVNRPIWWIILLIIPIVGWVVAIVITNDLAKAFGKGTGWTFGLLLLPFVFYPILGFGSDEFVGRPA